MSGLPASVRDNLGDRFAGASTLGASMRSGPGSSSTVAKMMREAGKAAARAQERKRTESMPGNQRGDIGYQEEKVAPSVLARRRKQFLEGTILGSLMPEPSIELGAPMSMLGSSTLLGS